MSRAEPFRNIERRAPINEELISPLAEGIQAARLHGTIPVEELTDLLQDEESQRAALYIPKAWLPTESHPDYLNSYRDAWWNTLAQPDQRADFVDGDIGELDSKALIPEVIKAAHLSPWLLEREIITPADVQMIYKGTNSELLRASFDDAQRNTAPPFLPNDTHPSVGRLKWLKSNAEDALTRSAALGIETFDEIETLMDSREQFDIQVALRAIARNGRKGLLYEGHVDWMRHQLENKEVRIRNRAVTAFRHLYNAGSVPGDILEEASVSTPRLAGELSKNIEEQIPALKEMVKKLRVNPVLLKAVHPIVVAGGSQLKGYAQEGDSDLDTAIFIAPGNHDTDVLEAELAKVFVDAPVAFQLEETPQGIRIKDSENGSHAGWSHLIYNAVWVGNADKVDSLRTELASAYEEDDELRTYALRRLEQDALQYRLLHKGYERHFAIRADDVPMGRDGLDSQSAFWDPRYRQLATQLFAEKVRLPKK